MVISNHFLCKDWVKIIQLPTPTIWLNGWLQGVPGVGFQAIFIATYRNRRVGMVTSNGSEFSKGIRSPKLLERIQVKDFTSRSSVRT